MTFRPLLTCIALSLMTVQPAWAQERTTFVGATLIDPRQERIQPDTYIVVENGRIAEVGQGRPVNAENVYDVSGLYVLPGLIDTHVHITLGPVHIGSDAHGPFMESVERPDIIEHNARRLLAYGVTTVRNPGGDSLSNHRYDARRAAGQITGPEAIHAFEIINRQPFPWRGMTREVTDETSAADLVQAQVKSGARYIKLYEGLTEADLAEGIEAAHAGKARTIGHMSEVSWTRAAELGIDALVHMMPTSPDLLPADRRADYMNSRRPGTYAFFEWYEAVDIDAPEITAMIEALVRHGVYVDATLVVFQSAFWGDDAHFLDRDSSLIHADLRDNWDGGLRFDAGWTAADYARAKAVWPKVLDLTHRMQAAGVAMTIGTDLGNPYVAPGRSVGREMVLHREAGIPAWAVLRMATSDAARALDIEDRLGAIEQGLEADMVFIRGNPLKDITAVSDVSLIVSDGKLYEPKALMIKE